MHAFREVTTLDTLRPLLARANVEHAALISAGYAMHDRAAARIENDFVATLVREDPRFLGYCGVHPLEDWATDELRRCKAELGLMGVKIHVKEQALDLKRSEHVAAVERLVDLAGSLGMITLAHLSAADWPPCVHIAERHPTATLVVAHALLHDYHELAAFGARLAMAQKLHFKAPENIYFEVSGLLTYYASSPYRDGIAWHLRALGKDRLLFGSDYPVYTPEETLAALQQYGFSADELRAMLVDNPRRVYSIH
jgi:predicted TIM-barrel fold metal-dependent hydrolase